MSALGSLGHAALCDPCGSWGATLSFKFDVEPKLNPKAERTFTSADTPHTKTPSNHANEAQSPRTKIGRSLIVFSVCGRRNAEGPDAPQAPFKAAHARDARGGPSDAYIRAKNWGRACVNTWRRFQLRNAYIS